MHDAAFTVKCNSFKCDDPDVRNVLAAHSAQNGKYVSLAHQSRATAGKPTLGPFVDSDLMAVHPKQCSGKEPSKRPADDPDSQGAVCTHFIRKSRCKDWTDARLSGGPSETSVSRRQSVPDRASVSRQPHEIKMCARFEKTLVTSCGRLQRQDPYAHGRRNSFPIPLGSAAAGYHGHTCVYPRVDGWSAFGPKGLRYRFGYTWGNGTLTFNNHRLGFTEEINIADLHSARCTPRRGDDNHLMTTRR